MTEIFETILSAVGSERVFSGGQQAVWRKFGIMHGLPILM